MPQRLHVRQLQTVGFVDKGDDPEAEIVFFKRADLDEPKPKGGEPDGLFRKFLNALGLGDDFAEDDVKKLLDRGGTNNEGDQTMTFDIEKLDDTAQAEFEKLQSRIEELEKALAEVTDEGDDDDVTKGMSDEVRAAFEKEREEREKTEKRLQDLLDSQERDRFIAKARTLDLPADDFADILRKTAGALEEEEFTKLEERIKALNKQVAESALYRTFGGGGGEPTTTEAEVEKRAREIMTEKGWGEREFSRAKGIVLKNDPALRQKLVAEEDERRANLGG